MNWRLLLLASIVTGLDTGLPNIDYRYNHNGQLVWCVYCSEEDIERNYIETTCFDKKLPTETHVVDGQNITFWAFCSSTWTEHYIPRYIKNCTAAPKIDGAKVDCRDEYGNEFYRVHDTCSVTCTGQRMVASENMTTCDPSTGTWTQVNCIPNACRPLRTKIEKNETTSCNTTENLPLNTKCEVSCPSGYAPMTRLLQCINGDWELRRACVAPSPSTEKSSDTSVPIILILVAGVVLVLLIIVVVLVYCRIQRRRRKRDESRHSETKSQNPLLQNYSTNSGSDRDFHGSNEEEDVETSFSSDGRSDTTVEGKDSPSQSLDERPPAYVSAVGYPPEEKQGLCANNSQTDGFNEEECSSVEVFYAFDNDQQGQQISESGILTVAEHARLILYAVCSKGHSVIQFNYGPCFEDDYLEKLGIGISMIIRKGDAGSYLLCAKCDHQGEVMRRVDIHVADSPDQTDVKQTDQSPNILRSLVGTVSEQSLSHYGSGPSQKLEAEPLSLPSNPRLSLLMETGGGAESGVLDGGEAGACGGKPLQRSTLSLASQTALQDDDDDDSEAEDCTLSLTELHKRSHKKVMDNLCELLEPLSKRNPDMTIGGATLHILGYSIDKVDHVIWAKREDLRNTPARTLLSMMIQAGKKAVHLVRYFAVSEHYHHQVIKILQKAHPGCPVCGRYK